VLQTVPVVFCVAAVGLAAQAPRLVRSVSGSKGHEQGGVYVVDDPRNSFHYPDDQQVVVQFEWEGEPGPHHFEGRWKNPTGKAVVISEFDYESPGRRFGGYWVLNLAEGTTPGLWALEAVVDGTVAGMHAFQISAEPVGADVTGPRRLTPAEIYARGLPALVRIDKLDPSGARIESGSGYVLAKDRILTAFQVVDGAAAVRVVFSDGTTSTARGALGWDRKGNWIVLEVSTGEVEALPAAPSDSFVVGDRVYTFDAPDESSRVLREGKIVGRQEFPSVGERLSLDVFVDRRATGSPALDGAGRVVAVLTYADLVPGLPTLSGVALAPGNVPHELLSRRLGRPVASIVLPPEMTVVSFEELSARNQFTPPLTQNAQLTEGTVGASVDRTDKKKPHLVGEGFDIAKSGGKVAVSLTWSPIARFSSSVVARLFDEDNRMVAQSEPQTVKLKEFEVATTFWELDASGLAPGIYRVDVVIDDKPSWRSFFRLVE
jgi:S1-C subfamily serine protease